MEVKTISINKPKPIKKNKKKPYTWFRFFVFLLFSSFTGAVVYVLATAFLRENPTFTYNSTKQLIEIKQVITNPGEIAFKNKERILILCLGLDENRDWRGIGHTKGSRTDTIFILNLDKKAEKMGVLSIPRDTLIHINDRIGRDRVNSAYSEAFYEFYEKSGHDYNGAKMAGIMQARKSIQDFIGMQVDYYILLKIKSCKEMVDAIGGLTLDVEKDMDYEDSWGKLYVHLKKGRQKLNGEQAVGYARFRYDEQGDWGRIRRQQQVIHALIKELKKPVHIMHINRLASILKNNLDTDLSFAQLVDIANVYKNFDHDKVIRGVITGTDDVTVGGAMIIIPDIEEKRRIVKRVLRAPSDIFPEDLRIRIVNSSSYPEIGEEVSEKLRQAHYNVVEVAEENNVRTDSDIIDHYENIKAVNMIEKTINFYTAGYIQKPNTSYDMQVDFTIILGNDYYEYQKAMAPPPPPPPPMPRIDVGEPEGSFSVTTK